jgi:hypothetical protein
LYVHSLSNYDCRLTTSNKAPVTAKPSGKSKAAQNTTNEDESAQLDSKMAGEGDQALAKSANNTAKPAEVPESPTDVKTNPSPPKQGQVQTAEPQRGKLEDMEDDGEHVEGDEDAVIY